MPQFWSSIWPVVPESVHNHVPRRYVYLSPSQIYANPEQPPLENTSTWQTHYERAASLHPVKGYVVPRRPDQNRGTLFAPPRRYYQNEHHHAQPMSSPHALVSVLTAPAQPTHLALRVAFSPASPLLLWHKSSSDISAVLHKIFQCATLSYRAMAQLSQHKNFDTAHLPADARKVDEWAHVYALPPN